MFLILEIVEMHTFLRYNERDRLYGKGRKVPTTEIMVTLTGPNLKLEALFFHGVLGVKITTP